jgi:hypothetical protein
MTITTVCSLFLAVCAAPVAAIAQGNAEAGLHYAYNSVAVSNENGAAVYGEYFLKRSSSHLHGRDTVGVIGEFDGFGSGSGSLYTYLFGIRLNTEWRKSHLVLHADYKAGGARARENGVTATGSNVSFVRNSFAWDIAGVGLESPDRASLRGDSASGGFSGDGGAGFCFGRRELAGRHADFGWYRLSL